MAIDYDDSMGSSLPIVVFITHHADEMLWNALRSASSSQNWIRELWVVHSNVSPSQIPSEFITNVRYHWLGDNLGFAAAVNWVFKNANGPVFIVNDDTILNGSCIKELCKAAQQSSKGFGLHF